MALVLGAYLVLLGRLGYWQFFRHPDMARLAAAYHDDTITLSAVRGNILDRNGALLVTNTPVFSIFASPDQISAAERQDIATRLAPVLGLSAADIQVKLAANRKFVYLARRVPALVAHQLDGLKLPGIGKIAETQRAYVDGGVAGRALADGVQKYQAESGSLIIMEPATGRIVAWADVPSYDANDFATTSTAQFIDPIVSNLYEPGSVMKVMTLAGALDVHAITPDTRFNETGVAVVGGVAIRNWDNKAHGNVSMTQVLQNSLNVGAIKVQQMRSDERRVGK